MKYIFFLTIFICHLYAKDANRLTFLGATTIQPVIESVRHNYALENGMKILTEGGGSDLGIKRLSENKINVAMVIRYLTPQEKENFAHAVIGYDALAIIVHKQNPINSLTLKQLVDIYRGKITRWSELGGVDKPIILISKQSNRGLLYLFEKGTGLFHPSNNANSNPAKTIATWAWDAGANNDNIVWTGGLPDAISYISLGSALAHIANGMPIKIVSLDGIFPSAKTIANHIYPIVGELSLVYHKNDIQAKKFIEYMLSDEAQQIVVKNKFNRVDDAK